jgi:hypothetical protein
MKKIVIAILVVVAFCWISVVSADNKPVEESPESIATCVANSGNGPYQLQTRSFPETINGEQCRTWEPDREPDPCAPCIISLEEQGCKIIDVVVTQVVGSENYEKILAPVTYLLSCDGR